MRGLWTFIWRNLMRRKLRYALTALGIVLGVANVFGVFVANATTNRALSEGSRSFFGSADVVVSPEETDAQESKRTLIPPSFSDAILERLRKLEGVEDAGPRSPTFVGLEARKGWLQPVRQEDDRSSEREPSVTLAGVGVALATRERVLESGRVFTPGADEAFVSRQAADRLGKAIGDEIEIRARETVRLEIVGTYTSEYADYPEVLIDRAVMNSVFGTKGVGATYIYLEDEVAPDVWVVDHQHDFPKLRMQYSGIPREFREFLDVIQGSLAGAATVALFVGAFLIYLTFTMTVVDRTRLYGTLHAIGATEAQVRRAVLGEALALGVAATALGLALGLVLAAGLVRIVSGVVGIGRPQMSVTPGAVAAGLAVGVVATFIGALTPARRAGRISPVDAIREATVTASRVSKAWVLGIACVAMGLAIHAWNQEQSRVTAGPSSIAPTLFLLLGAVLLVPLVVPLLARGVRAVTRRVAPGLGDVAVMHLVRERTRSAYTLGLVMVVLAMIMTLGAAHGSLGGVVERWVETRFGADLLVYGDRLRADHTDRVGDIDGVRAVTAAGFDRVRVVGPTAQRVHNLIVIDPDTFFDVAGFPWANGEDSSVKRALSRGGSVVLPATTAVRLGLERGDSVNLRTRQGPRRFELAGTFASIAAGPEIGFVAGVKDGRTLFAMSDPNVLYIGFEKGARPRDVTRSIETALAGSNAPRGVQFGESNAPRGHSYGGFFFVTGSAIKAQARQVVDGYLRLFLAVLLVGMVVGLVGLANTLTTSVLLRYREIGTLQAVGASPDGVRRMIAVESGALVLVALGLAVVLGALLSRVILSGGNALLGFRPPYVFPWAWLPALAVLALVVAVTAAVAPARRAARLTPIEALRYE